MAWKLGWSVVGTLPRASSTTIGAEWPLVGTFLGVYIAYGFVGPIAAKMNQTYEEDAQFYAIIRDCLVAYLQGHSAPIVVELARGNVPTTLQPSFHAMDEVLGTMPSDPLAASA